ncbi:MAG: thiamine pyrophosphate-dependent enzyme [Thermodesulfobacteriota bacterium]
MDNKKIAQDIMWLRLAQMVVNEEYKAGRFKIPIHLAFGHEAIAVAVNHLMESNDLLILSHRNIAYNLVRLRSLRPILNEYYLKSDGLMRGKLGSMNLINPQKGIIYSSSTLGNNFSVATGVAMAQKMLRPDGLTIVLGGDGAIEEGTFHESLIMFKTLNLSTIILIENNEWSMSTRISERRCPIDLEKLTSSYDIKYMKLEGNDPYVYLENLRKSRNLALGGMPVCIEVSVSTMGDWIMKTPEYPDGKFVNYHAGPAPNIELKKWPLVLRTNEEDPIFVLNKYFSSSALEEMADAVYEELNRELA